MDTTNYINCFGKRTPIVLSHGEGCYVTDIDNETYLDMLSGIAVNVLGHNNRHLVNTVSEQAAKLIHVSNIYYNEPQSLLAKALVRYCDMERVFFCNSGAEANEAAIKLVRGYFNTINPERTVIHTAENSFHGRTLTTVTATGQPKYNEPFKPLPTGFNYLSFNDIPALQKAISRPDTAAVMLELIQGESGVHPVSQYYAEEAERLCRQQGVFLIVDEIQTGMGRTGSFTAAKHYGIKPDIITLAKGLGGGIPIGAMLAKGDVTKGFQPGSHGTTFGGNPLACAAALAVLDEYERLNLVDEAGKKGDRLMQQIRCISDRFPNRIIAVRGCGLMIAIDFKENEAGRIRDDLLAAGVLVNATGPHTLRLLPPLIISNSEIDHFSKKLESVLSC